MMTLGARCVVTNSIMDKKKILDLIIAVLRSEMENLLEASRSARSGATDDENKSEGKYDTRSTEANYLADGQAKQAEETRIALDGFLALSVKPMDRVGLGALVEMDMNGFFAYRRSKQ